MNNHAYAPGNIPPGITFGEKVLMVPDTSYIFDRPIWIQACIKHNPKELHAPYTWITWGDPFAKFTILTPKTGVLIIDFFANKSNQVFLRNPVRGLLTHSYQGYGGNNRADHNTVRTALLLPVDEPLAENGDYIFSDLCGFCWGWKEYIFYKPSEFRNKFNDEKLCEAFDEQINRKCDYINAIPKYERYLDEARTKHAQLRPFLKHLL